MRSARVFVAAAPLGACASLFVRCADPVSPRPFPALFNNVVGIEYRIIWYNSRSGLIKNERFADRVRGWVRGRVRFSEV
jgi:hypothetical protein